MSDPTEISSKLCYCGRPYNEEFNRHDDDGDPWWCYPEEAGVDDESRCNAMWDGEEPR